ncbi:helix-turn-helix domain-containing protein [Ktedonobacter racemifer]|uniref:Helix-turn-helix domain-containing protein n=1 Tax=Ktedonobacter racemifer DSM 44963 TaxID=485913 RepID=D6U7K9_KTERA|nr:helix-turn-helix domain-containing protein [Ktedonobacter racemifer]EFH79870.1 hypothetical protein Krac_0390 [Ktedonobacter racemifer DSM 44963]
MKQERRVLTLAELTEEQRAEAYRRYEVVRACVEEGIAQTVVARERGVPVKTLQRWVRQYREYGLCGLARQARADRGTQRMSEEWFCQNSEDDLVWRPLMEYACEKQTSDEE